MEYNLTKLTLTDLIKLINKLNKNRHPYDSQVAF